MSNPTLIGLEPMKSRVDQKVKPGIAVPIAFCELTFMAILVINTYYLKVFWVENSGKIFLNRLCIE
ncbi:MAG: hypothetical protein VW874_03635, partial [Gammaproteobacteria bacterium]